MDNCTRCGDIATTTVTVDVRRVSAPTRHQSGLTAAFMRGLGTSSGRYCNPCSVEIAKRAEPGVQVMFDRALTPEEERAIYEAHTSAADVLAGRGPMRLVGTASLVE